MVAFNLYSKIPFGQIHDYHPDIVKFAEALGRPSASLSWKMCNLASQDPLIDIGGTRIAKMETAVWDEFRASPSDFLEETERLVLALLAGEGVKPPTAKLEAKEFPQGETRERTVKVRFNQPLFRKFVLSAYESRCCITGISVPALLTASHIIPWKENHKERINPHNGLCLNALHDRAFDRGLITVTPDFVVRVSPKLKSAAEDSPKMRFVLDAEGKKIAMPKRYAPGEQFLDFHNSRIFQA